MSDARLYSIRRDYGSRGLIIEVADADTFTGYFGEPSVYLGFMRAERTPVPREIFDLIETRKAEDKAEADANKKAWNEETTRRRTENRDRVQAISKLAAK